MFVDITQQCFALLPQVNFPANNLKAKVMGSKAIFLNLFYFNKNITTLLLLLLYNSVMFPNCFGILLFKGVEREL